MPLAYQIALLRIMRCWFVFLGFRKKKHVPGCYECFDLCVFMEVITWGSLQLCGWQNCDTDKNLGGETKRQKRCRTKCPLPCQALTPSLPFGPLWSSWCPRLHCLPAPSPSLSRPISVCTCVTWSPLCHDYHPTIIVSLTTNK